MAILNWKSSFESADVSDIDILRQALAYKCYLGSEDAVRQAVDRLTAELECDEVLSAFHMPLDNEYCLGNQIQSKPERVYHLIDKAKIFPNPASDVNMSSKTLLKKIIKLNSEERKKKILFISDWCDQNGNSKIADPKTTDCLQLLKSLGMCGRSWLKGHQLVILCIDPKIIYKSTWVDGRLNLIWYSNPQDPDWGITRNLDTGLPELKEWVVKNEKDQYEIVKHYIRSIEEDCHLGEDSLSDQYWNGCRQEILEARV